MTYRAALIGCGRIGSLMADDPLMAGDVFTHAEAYKRSVATELVAVCDADPGLAKQCAQRWNVGEAFDDISALLDAARPDIVSIATPDSTHFEVARTVLEHRSPPKGIICEKPLATSLDEAALLVKLAADQGVELAVVHMRRYATNLRMLKALFERGEFGSVTAVVGFYTKGVLHNGVHWFDQLRMLAGQIAWVEAADRLRDSKSDPTLDVTLGLESGAVATLRAVDARSFTIFEMDILTDRARIRITDSGHRIELFRVAPSPRYSGYTELLPVTMDFGERRDLMLRAVDDLAAALKEDRPPASSGVDGLAALRVATAALKAKRTRKRVAIRSEDALSG